MKFKSILIYCPYEGLFCKHVTTFVGNDESEIELQMATRETDEFDQLMNVLTISSAYDYVELTIAVTSNKGVHALIELAAKWGWLVKIWEGDCDD